MKGRFSLELVVGVFMIVGILCLGILSVRLGKMDPFGRSGYPLYAVFSDVGGLRVGAPVEVAGVEVGRVDRIGLEDGQARVGMRITPSLMIREDSIASVKTRGLIGEKYVQISAGASDQILPPGGSIRQTESAVDLESLISQGIFGKL